MAGEKANTQDLEVLKDWEKLALELLQNQEQRLELFKFTVLRVVKQKLPEVFEFEGELLEHVQEIIENEFADVLLLVGSDEIQRFINQHEQQQQQEEQFVSMWKRKSLQKLKELFQRQTVGGFVKVFNKTTVVATKTRDAKSEMISTFFHEAGHIAEFVIFRLYQWFRYTEKIERNDEIEALIHAEEPIRPKDIEVKKNEDFQNKILSKNVLSWYQNIVVSSIFVGSIFLGIEVKNFWRTVLTSEGMIGLTIAVTYFVSRISEYYHQRSRRLYEMELQEYIDQYIAFTNSPKEAIAVYTEDMAEELVQEFAKSKNT